MREVEIQAKNVQTAVEQALAQLGLRRDQAEVVVRQEGTSGFLGLGAKPAKVLVREKKWGTPGGEQVSERPEKPAFRSGGPKRERGGGQRGGRGGGGGRNFRQGGGGPRRQGGRAGYSVNSESFEKIPIPTLVPDENVPDLELAPLPPEMEKPAEDAKIMLTEILAKMGISAKEVKTGWDAAQGRLLMNFDCDTPEAVIGRDGQTLEAAQYLITLMLSRKYNAPFALQADTGKYWRKIEHHVAAIANAGASDVERTGRPYRLEPMSSQMRRFVHRMLAANPKVETASEGEGKWRKVVIKPKPAAK